MWNSLELCLVEVFELVLKVLSCSFHWCPTLPSGEYKCLAEIHQYYAGGPQHFGLDANLLSTSNYQECSSEKKNIPQNQEIL